MFSGAPNVPAVGGARWTAATYDTWSIGYERDGIDQDDDGDTDEGTNGLDDENSNGNKVNGVDDVGERETSPPYPVPLRGVEVTIRMLESDTRQVKQASAIADFVPE